jgi:capsular exopolysaccharide synthesis family protein
MNESPQEILYAPARPGQLNELPGANQRGEFLRLLPKLRDISGLANHFAVCFTSSVEGEGTTTVAAQFAVSVAESGSSLRTLLVDGNLKNPCLQELLALPLAPGLTEVCNDGVPVKQAIQATELDDLDVLTVGNFADQRAHYLNSLRYQELIQGLKDEYDLVVIDCPPLAAGHGSTHLPKGDAFTALVVAASRTNREVIEGALHELQLVGADVVGVVLNRRQFFIPTFVYRRI